ncbi:g10757 [Coccomyxa elongata]
MKSLSQWFPPSVRVALFIAALVVFGIVDVDIFLPKLIVSKENNAVVFKHGGWERMGLRNRSRILAPGDRLQPLDELEGARKASPYGGVLMPSPYASVGKLKRFLGNIRTTAVLKSALQARSHKGEVILVPFTEPELALALNMVLNLRKLSFDHFLLLGFDKACCLHAAAVISDIGCVWTTYLADGELEMFPRGLEGDRDIERLQLLRWHTATRMVRQGYNVLTLDAEGHLSDDPYAYLKASPLQTANLVTMTHGGWGGLTTGLVYAQNAAVDGPVAWALAEVVLRALQYAEHPGFMEEKGLSAPASLLEMLRESSLLNDATASACCGRPVAWHSIWSHARRGRDENGRVDDEEIYDAHLKLAEKVCHRKEIDVDLDTALQARLGITGGRFYQLPLRVPEEPSDWPEALGGRVGPAKPGRLAREWAALLRSEETAPWNASRSELLLQPYMYGRYMEYGHNGLRNGAFYVEPRPVFFAHMMGIRAALPSRAIVMKALGMWHWEVVRMLEEVGFQAGSPLAERKVLAFAPEALPLRLDTEQQVRAALMGLLQLAVLSGRVPVWPDFACDSPWLYEEGARERANRRDDPKHWFGADFRADLEVVPRQPVDGAPSSRRCLVWRYYDIPCNVHGMNLLDFFYLRDELLPPEKAQPTAKNTILRNENEAGIAKFISAADIDWLDAYMTKIQDEPIAYLGRVVNIAGLGSRWELEETVEKVQRSCLAEMSQVSMDRRLYTAVGDHSAAKGEEMALEEIRALEEGPPVEAHREERPAKEAAAASVGEEAERQAREAASRVEADLATSRAETAAEDNIKKLGVFANVEEQLNRRAEDAAEHRSGTSRADDARIKTASELDNSGSLSLEQGAAKSGDLAEPNQASLEQGKKPVEDEEPYSDYDDEAGGGDAAGGAKGRARNAIEGILLRGPAAATAGGTDRSRNEAEKDGLSGGGTQEDRGELSNQGVEAEERSGRERLGEAGRETLHDVEGAREEEEEEEVDEEAERKQAEIDAIAAEEAAAREAEKEAAAAEVRRKEAREREAARLAEEERRQQEIRQAQERAAAEDRRRNEAERAELNLEGGGGMLLDPVQLGFHEPEEAEGTPVETTPELVVDGPKQARPEGFALEGDVPKQDVPDQGAAERGGDERTRENDASERGEDVVGRGAEARHPAAEVEEAEERRTGVLNVQAGGVDTLPRLESAPGEAGRDGQKVLQSRDESVFDPAAAEERDVVRMGWAEEGDLSRGAESTRGLNRQKPASDGAPAATDPPDTLVLGAAMKKGTPAGVKLKPVELADDAPRLLGYRRAKDDASPSGDQGVGRRSADEDAREIEPEMKVLEEDDTGGQGVGKISADEDALENETDMTVLEGEDEGGQGIGSISADENALENETDMTVVDGEDAGGQGVGREGAEENAGENDTEMRVLEEEDARPTS